MGVLAIPMVVDTVATADWEVADTVAMVATVVMAATVDTVATVALEDMVV